MTNTETSAAILTDESASTSRQGYQLVRTYRIGPEIVQITVAVDSYKHQSWAAAKILGPDRKWETLVSAAPGLWYDAMSSYMAVSTADRVVRECEWVANSLLSRARSVLL